MNALEPRHLQVVERWTLILSAVAIAATFVVAPLRVAFAAAVGCALMVANAWTIRRLAEGLFARATTGSGARPGLGVLLFNVKMFALIALVYVAIKVLHLDAIGFLVGVSVFPAAIVLAALRLGAGARGGEATPPASPHPPHSPDFGDR